MELALDFFLSLLDCHSVHHKHFCEDAVIPQRSLRAAGLSSLVALRPLTHSGVAARFSTHPLVASASFNIVGLSREPEQDLFAAIGALWVTPHFSVLVRRLNSPTRGSETRVAIVSTFCGANSFAARKTFSHQ
jgi:hypothetical protein